MNEQPKSIYELFKTFSWASYLEINELKKFIKLVDSEDFILKKEGDFLKLFFYDFNDETKKIEKRKDYIQLFVHKDLDLMGLFKYWSNSEKNSYGYSFSKELWIFKKIFEGITTIKVSDVYKKELEFKSKELLVRSGKLKEILKTIENINKKASSSKASLLNHLVNQSKFDFLNKKTKGTTSVIKGDFDFIVHRFNLATKNTKEDFQKYLDKNDIKSLSDLLDKMIRKEVFEEEYLRRLDNYFVKEKLEDALAIGKKILSIKTDSVKSVEIKILLKNIFKEDIGQLETVWQKYFEKYLLYLFFSYKKIVPKVELKNLNNLDKQYPDFIGVNHYDGVDIIEIKTHLKNILVWDNSHKNFAFSPEMSKALIQTINYMDAISDHEFKKTKEKKSLLEYLNVDENLCRPRGIIIISSIDKICKSKLTEEQKSRLKKDFTKLRNSIHNIQIFTFNEILEIAEKYIENITKETS